MKVAKTFISVYFFTVNLLVFSQIFHTTGVSIKVDPGVYVNIDGSAQVSSGEMFVDAAGQLNGIVRVNGDFINNGVSGGSGYFMVSGDWLNNQSFVAQQGTVILNGQQDQNVGGTVSTQFYNLVLDGSGIKYLTRDQYVLNKLILNHLELNTLQYTMYVENTDAASIERTSGFVSSTGDGGLSRKTNSDVEYLFPVGSSTGTPRYRPVIIKPVLANHNTFHVRFANVNATTEGFDISLHTQEVCRLNELFYHRIFRSQGNSPAQLKLFFDPDEDGQWEGISHWTSGGQWHIITNSDWSSAMPMAYVYVNNWDNFTERPYILHLKNVVISQLEVHSESCIDANDGWATLTLSGGEPPYTILWNNAIGDDSITNLQPGMHHVVVIDNRGCIYEENFEIQASSEECLQPNVWVPNIFSPNGDGENDILYVYGQGIKELNFSVYNRWGELIFQTNNIQEGWDGTYKGKRCSPNVFVYLLDVTLVNNQNYKFYGTVTLVH